MIPEEYRGKYFYHFTHVSNIPSIVENGLLCTNEKNRLKISHENIANDGIQNRRNQMIVPCYPHGTVHDYVPFYFTSVNPMLLGLLNKKVVDQSLIVFIAISIEKLIENNVIFTNASANTNIPPTFYNNPTDLDNLDWIEIDSKRWGYNNINSRMAEVLIHNRVPIDWIDSFIVFDNICHKEITNTYLQNTLPLPKISYTRFNNKPFYFKKFFVKGQERESLVTGPLELNYKFRSLVKDIKKTRKSTFGQKPSFTTVKDALNKIEENFCIIKELEGIYELSTSNETHSKNVSDHTKEVVENLTDNKYYNKLYLFDKEIVKLASYLHDIGKGPKSKWKDEIQPPYPDHPADAVPMLKRILVEEFESLSEEEIRKICLLVIYHDIIGEILCEDRNSQELIDLKLDDNDLNMLIALSLADVTAINSEWARSMKKKLPEFKKFIKQGDLK